MAGPRTGRALAVALSVGMIGCGGGSAKPAATGSVPATQGTPTRLALPPASGAAAERGREIAGSGGCLACHRIGGSGNDGPGPPLTAIGARLTPRELRRVLVHPTAPMPSFRALGAQRLADLIAYLSQLGRG